MKRVGLPRALLYYQYWPLFHVFFEELGAEVVVSGPTTPAMLAAGSSRVVADTCLPAKVFIGHVISLAGSCDYIFVPEVRSTSKNLINCSKFLGLPDMTRAVVPDFPPILEITIDIEKGRRKLFREIYRLGRIFTRNPLRIRIAALKAWEAYKRQRETMAAGGFTISQAMGLEQPPSRCPGSTVAKIALIGHPYLLYDDYVNHRLVFRLKQLGCTVVTAEMLTSEELASGITRLAGKPYWTYESEIVGAGGHFLNSKVDGVIGITAFGCGPDSLMMDMVRRKAAREKSVPFMSLTLDEHTAEAGLITRLEAFTDMLQRCNKEAKCA